MSALSDALNAANVNTWSSREIARRGGNKVSHTQIAKYFRPDHPTPTDQVLAVFAEVFPALTITRLRQLAGQPVGEAEPYEPPTESARMSGRQRRAVDELIRSMVSLDPASLFTARLQEEADRLGITLPRYTSEFELNFFRARDARIAEVRPELDRLLMLAGGDVGEAAEIAREEDDLEPLVADLLQEARKIIGDEESTTLSAAARDGVPRLRAIRDQLDDSTEAPDPLDEEEPS